MTIEIIPVTGMPDVRPGDDLPALIATSARDLRDGDVVVVTQKVVSKAEGRLVTTPTDDAGRDLVRRRAVEDEAVRIVARRGDTVITQTRHGFVTAASGVDASNMQRNEIALLPVDADRSSQGIRSRLRALLGVDVAVVVSDTSGRPWRYGLTDVAIGAAGIAPLRDHRGQQDPYGNTLNMTEVAVVDELASAAELVMGKTDGVPVAIVRGVRYRSTDEGIRSLIRPVEDDMFRLGTDEARRSVIPGRRSVRSYLPDPVDPVAVERAVAAAVTAPAPHHSEPWRFVLVEDRARRTQLLDAMQEVWAEDLRSDGFAEDAIDRRLARGEILRRAPYLVIPCFVGDGMHSYPDARRRRSEREMFLVSVGAGVQNLLLALSVEGLASCWVGSTLFCQDLVQDVLGLSPDWEPMGAVAVGVAADVPAPRPEPDPTRFITRR